MANKKLIVTGAGILLLFLLAIAGLFVSPLLQSSTPTSSYIEVPAFGWYECSPFGSVISVPSGGTGYTIPATEVGEVTSCGEHGETTQCTYTITAPEEGVFSLDRRIRYERCDTNGNNCQEFIVNPVDTTLKQNDVLVDFTASTDNVVAMHYERRKFFGGWTPVEADKDVAHYTVQFQPYALKRSDTFGGGRTTLNSQNCEFRTTSDKSLLVLSSTIAELAGTGTTPDKLSPNEEFNYISRFVPISSQNEAFQTHNGELVYCRDDRLWEIEQVKTPSGTYNVVQSDFNSAITSVQCCNGDNTPTQTCVDNKWVSTEGVECSIFNPCAGSDWAPLRGDPNTIISYTCQVGQCVSQTEDVECTQNSQCGSGICGADFECTEAKQGDIPLSLPSLQGPEYSLAGLLGIFGSTLFYITLIFAAIATLIVYLVLARFFRERKQQAIVAIISLLVGLLLGVLFYKFWWLAAIIVVILLIVRFALGRFLGDPTKILRGK